MTDSDNIFDVSLENQAWELLAHAKTLQTVSNRLEREAREKIIEHYGLVKGKTMLRSRADDTFGWTGRYVEVVNFLEGQMPWVRVQLEPLPPNKEGNGRAQNFFGKWEIIEDEF